MALWRVSTRTARSMPLSFATWSRIMFRLTVGACGAGDAISSALFFSVVGGAEVERGLHVRLADLVVGDGELLAVDVDHDPSVGESLEHADERLPVLALRDRAV